VADAHPETYDDVPEDIIFASQSGRRPPAGPRATGLAAGKRRRGTAQARNLLETRAARVIGIARTGSAERSKVTRSAERDYVEALSQNLLLEASWSRPRTIPAAGGKR